MGIVKYEVLCISAIFLKSNFIYEKLYELLYSNPFIGLLLPFGFLNKSFTISWSFLDKNCSNSFSYDSLLTHQIVESISFLTTWNFLLLSKQILVKIKMLSLSKIIIDKVLWMFFIYKQFSTLSLSLLFASDIIFMSLESLHILSNKKSLYKDLMVNTYFCLSYIYLYVKVSPFNFFLEHCFCKISFFFKKNLFCIL